MLVLILIVLICMLIHVLCLRGRRNHPGMAAFRGKYYAHRGLHDETKPENSMAAFAAALEKGYGIEFDLHLLKDGTLAVMHDSDLKRTTGQEGTMEDLTARDLTNYHLGGTDQVIPTFRQVLDLFQGEAPLIIELKTKDGNADALTEATVEMLKDYQGPYCIESFDPFAVRWYRKNARSVVRGQLSFMPPLKDKPFKEKLRRIALGYLLIDFLGRPDFIAYGYKTDANISFRIVANIFRPLLAAWTVCDQETYRELQQYYDIQIFERFRAQ